MNAEFHVFRCGQSSLARGGLCLSQAIALHEPHAKHQPGARLASEAVDDDGLARIDARRHGAHHVVDHRVERDVVIGVLGVDEVEATPVRLLGWAADTAERDDVRAGHHLV